MERQRDFRHPAKSTQHRNLRSKKKGIRSRPKAENGYNGGYMQ